MNREQAQQDYKDLRRETIGAAEELGPVMLAPLLPNQRRMFFSRESYLDFLKSGLLGQLLDNNESVTTQLTVGGEFAVTTTAKAEAAGAGQ